MQGASAYLRFQTRLRRFASESRRWFTPKGSTRLCQDFDACLLSFLPFS